MKVEDLFVQKAVYRALEEKKVIIIAGLENQEEAVA
jgi:hypothetical protein